MDWDDARLFLKKHEGFRDSTYFDGNGFPTIGYGFTDPALVKKGKISEQEADKILTKRIKSDAQVLRQKLGPTVWDQLKDTSKTALLSYYYNYPAGFKDTTKFMAAWRKGNYREAIRQVDAGMNDPNNPGLKTRRLEEQGRLLDDPLLNIEKTYGGTPDLSKYSYRVPQFKPVDIVANKINTQYPLNDTTPKSISSWSGADAPNATPRLKDFQEVQNQMSQQDVWDTFNNVTAWGKRKAAKPDPEKMLADNMQQYIKDIINLPKPEDATPTFSRFMIPNPFYS